MNLSHPKINDKYLVIRTQKEVEIAESMHGLNGAMTAFTTACELDHLPAWIVDIDTGRILASADKIGQVVTPDMILDQSKPELKT